MSDAFTWLHSLLELLPTRRSRRLRRLAAVALARSGMIAREHESIEIGAQRGAVIAVERRAHPGGQRRIPRRLQIALRRERPAASQYAAAALTGSLRQLLAHPRRESADRRAWRSMSGRGQASRSSALAHQSSTRSRASPAGASRDSQRPTRRRRPRRRTRPSKNSASPRPTTNSARSRGVEALRIDAAQALARAASDRRRPRSSRKRSRYARAGDQIGGVGARRRQPRLLGRGDRLVELRAGCTAGAPGRADRGRRRRRAGAPRAQAASATPSGDATHRAMVAQRAIQPNHVEHQMA